jgi:hypothetical protein
MISTNAPAHALGIVSRAPAESLESPFTVRRSNLTRALVPRFTVLILALAFAAISPPRMRAQTTPPNCTASSDAAVQCFVANAVTTGLTQPRYGMTLAQFQAYGVAVTKILQTDQTYLGLVGLCSEIAAALPPTNAEGT